VDTPGVDASGMAIFHTAIPADIYFLEARIHYFMENFGHALISVNHAVRTEEDRNLVANENGYLFQRTLEYRRENFVNCLAIQRKLVEHYNKDVHWRDLALFFGLAGDEGNQLSALDTAWILGGLTTEGDLVKFSWLLQNANVPYKSAQVLQNGFTQNVLQKTQANYQQLGLAWYKAMELSKAITSMEKAALLSADNGNIYGLLTAMYLEAERYHKAVWSAQQGLLLGKLQETGRLYINLGTAFLELDKFDLALQAFAKAGEDKRTAELATKWREHSIHRKTNYVLSQSVLSL